MFENNRSRFDAKYDIDLRDRLVISDFNFANANVGSCFMLIDLRLR